MSARRPTAPGCQLAPPALVTWLAVSVALGATGAAYAAEPAAAAGEPTAAAEQSKPTPVPAVKPATTEGAKTSKNAGSPEFDEEDFEDEDEEAAATGDAAVGSVAGPTGPDVASRKPARPELEEAVELPEPPPWQRRLEIGGGVLYGNRPLFHDRAENTVSYEPAIGFGFHLRWDLLRFLRISAYFADLHHDVIFPTGALTTDGPSSVSPNAAISETTATTFSFGARLEPVLWLNDRARIWLTAGVGWGRFEFPTMDFTEPSGAKYTVRDRASVFVEFPLGMGAAFDVIERWLALEYELTIAPTTGQSGEALETFQAVDAEGRILDVGPLEPFDLTVLHGINVVLIL